MTIESEAKHLDLCPFANRCILPQMEMLCKYPECKVCPEYQAKIKSMNKK